MAPFNHATWATRLLQGGDGRDAGCEQPWPSLGLYKAVPNARLQQNEMDVMRLIKNNWITFELIIISLVITFLFYLNHLFYGVAVQHFVVCDEH